MELNDFPHDGDDEAKQRWFKGKTAEMWCLKTLTGDLEEAAEYQRKEIEQVQKYQKKEGQSGRSQRRKSHRVE